MKASASTHVLAVFALWASTVPPCARAQEEAPLEFRDPETCAPCHPRHYLEWRGSAHAYAAVDPVVQACIRLATAEAGAEMGRLCIGCHVPALARGAGAETPPAEPLDLGTATDSAMRGVTCDVCHRMRPGADERPLANANFELSPGQVYKGRLVRPAPTSDHEMATSDYIGSPTLCGSCHDVFHAGGLLESTHAQWSASIYRERADECSDCHMLRYSGKASVDGRFREELRRHNFPAVTLPLVPFPNRGLQEEGVLEVLRATARMSARWPGAHTAGTPLELRIKVKNVGAGHNLPSGISNKREMWLEVVVEDVSSGAVVFRSGQRDSSGDLLDFHSREAPGGDAQLVSFRDRLLDGEGREVTFFWRAKSLDVRSLKPLEERTVRYSVPTPADLLGARLRVRVRLLYRPFPPYALRELGLEELAEQVPVWELATLESPPVPVVREAPRPTVFRFPDDFSTLAEAARSLRPGDTLEIQPGEHTTAETLRLGGTGQRWVGAGGSTGTTIRYIGPASSPSASVLDLTAEGPGPALEGPWIEGLTLAGGWGTLEADGLCRGGGALIRGTSPVLRDVRIVDCAVTSRPGSGLGGGIFLESSGARLEDVTLAGCAASRGGGLALGPSVASKDVAEGLLLRGLVIRGCVAEDGGAAILLPGARATFERLEAAGDRARKAGGAIFVSKGASLELRNATIVHCESEGEAGAIRALSAEPPLILRSIFWSNSPAEGDGRFVGCLTESAQGQGPARLFPLFVDPGGYWEGSAWVPGDYRLLLGSPAIDAAGPGAPLDPDDSWGDLGAHFLEQPLRPFVRGDTDGDGVVGPADVAPLVDYLEGGKEPRCLDALDLDDNGHVDVGDILWLTGFLLGEAPRPRPPYPGCGPDPTFNEGLSCQRKADPCRGPIEEAR